jgi:hypothetical protein
MNVLYEVAYLFLLGVIVVSITKWVRGTPVAAWAKLGVWIVAVVACGWTFTRVFDAALGLVDPAALAAFQPEVDPSKSTTSTRSSSFVGAVAAPSTRRVRISEFSAACTDLEDLRYHDRNRFERSGSNCILWNADATGIVMREDGDYALVNFEKEKLQVWVKRRNLR